MKHFIKTVLFDVFILLGIFLISYFFPDKSWSVALIMIVLSSLGMIIGFSFFNDELKAELFKVYDKKTYKSKSWYVFYVYGIDFITLCLLICFDYKVTTGFFVFFIFAELLINDAYKKHLEEKQ